MGLLAKLLLAASAASLSPASPVGLDPQALEPAMPPPISHTETGGIPARDGGMIRHQITPRTGTTEPEPEIDADGIPPLPERRGIPSPELHEAAEADAAACTSTLTLTPHYPCTTEAYETVYPSTRTLLTQVDCGRCQELFIPRVVYFCPLRRILGIRTVNEPSTSWSTVCATRLGRRASHHATRAASAAPATPTDPTTAGGDNTVPRARRQAACRTTRVVQPQRTAGPVATQHQRVVTETVRLNCAGCELQLSTAVGGYGPVVRFTTTTTLPTGTSTVFVCQ
ncbi:hypothetical protein RB595_006199 [Gaeumannomyces hyphopodioides]